MTLSRDRAAPGLTLVVTDVRRVVPRAGEGIARQPDGSYRVRVSVGPRGHVLTAHRRFPPHTSRRLMRDWQTGARARLLDRLPDVAISGTLAADVAAYLAAVPVAEREGRRILLEHWTAAYGSRPTLSLTATDVRRQLDTWRTTKAASTCNHRLSALAGLFAARYPESPAPTQGQRRYREPSGVVPTWTLADVRAVLEHMPESPATYHLAVFAETGIPPIRIGRVTPADLDLKGRTVYLEGRRKGRGTPGRRFPLSAAAVTAWEDFDAARAYGRVPKNTLMLAWVKACKAAKRVPCRVYDLRHIFGAEAYRRCRDIRAVAELMDITIQTALRYTRGAVSDVLAAAVTALDA